KVYINLWNFIGEDLLVNGVPPENITIGGTDSVTEVDCYSYCREAGRTGRMALFGMLQDR
ncbi:MAG: laccase domain-containing protein, partial [Veillonella sp.]|uniref:laccase domain-containing protein n=1 Tax=Veillonella sp. TaxID=1926307 RepID=UPI00290BCD8E